MSEQAMIDDATTVMRSRFLSCSQRIATHLSWLEEHAEEIRADVRGSVSASAEKIQGTLKNLIDQMDRLPGSQWERFKAMLALLRAQQDVLDSAEALMQRARANSVPRKRPDPIQARLPVAATSGVASVSGGRSYGKNLLVMARDTASLRLVLVGIVAVGLAFGYVSFTRDDNRQHSATKPAGRTTGDAGRPVAHMATPPEGASARVSYDLVATSSPPTRVPQAADATSVNSTSSTSPSSRAAATVPAPIPSAVATDRPDTAELARGADERYVAVVFTGKDQAKVLQAFAELRIRYPKLLSSRRADTQPVDLGQKGIWHRLMVLPPGSRQSVQDFCDQLRAAGYDRCWVKGY